MIGVYAMPGKRPRDPMEVLSPSEAARRSSVLESLGQDLRHAARALLGSPGVSALVVLALALGIGANTAIFSVIDAVLLRPLPFENPERVVQIVDRFEKYPDRREMMLSFPNFRDYESASSFRHVASIRPANLYLHRGEERPQTAGAHFSSELLEMMGVQPSLGRGFTAEEDALDPAPVVLLSHGYWEREMGADRNVLGRTLTVTRFVQGDGWQPVELEIVGVLPPDFELPALLIGDEYRTWTDAEIFLPLGMWDWGRGNRGMYAHRAVAELAPDVSLIRAREELARIARGIRESDPEAEGLSVELLPLGEVRRDAFGPALWLLWAASGLILLVVCANVASLLLGRAVARERELALRTTLGASRGRIFRQLLTESALLGAIGGALALLLAPAGIELLKGLTPGTVHGLNEAGLHLPVLLFSAGAALTTVLFFGLGPALRGGRTDPAAVLRSGGRGAPTGDLLTLRWLVVGQVSVSLVLLVGAGLLIRSLDRLLAVDPGFQPEGVVRVSTELPPPPLSSYRGDEDVVSLFRQLQERLEGLPGVVRVGGSNRGGGPLTGQSANVDVTMADRPAPAPQDRIAVRAVPISPGYFEALGIPLIEGRVLRSDEHLASAGGSDVEHLIEPIPVLVNRRMAGRFWPDESAIGKRFYYGVQDPEVVRATMQEIVRTGRYERSEAWDRRYPAPRPLEVVGVVADVKSVGLSEDAPPSYYMPNSYTFRTLFVRTAGNPDDMIPMIRAELRSVEPTLEIQTIRTMEQVVRERTAETRFRATLLSLFAGLAVVMTGLGLFGVLAYAVSRRRHEMAVRISLGADRGDVSGMILREGLVLSGAGIVVGVLLAVGGLRLGRGLLYGVEPTDPVTLSAATVLVLVVSAAACWLPAVRATRVEPMELLREE